MLARLARLMYRRRWYVAGVWIVVLAVASVATLQVGSILGPGEFQIKNSESYRASQVLERDFHQNDQKTSFVVLANSTHTARDPIFIRAASRVTNSVRGARALHVSFVDNPLTSNNRQMIAKDGHAVAIMLSSALSERQMEDQIAHLRQLVRQPGFRIYVTGTAAANFDYAVSSKSDLARGDAVSVPILVLILVLVFGTLVASGLPLVLGGCSILLSLALVFIVGHWISTSIYVTNVVMFLGIGIGVDYTLFIVYRFREELVAQAGNVESAVVRTMDTTGRAVFFSGLTVAIGLSSLILTNLSFMQSMGLGGMLVPCVSVLLALTLLPAVLGILGDKVNRLRVVPSRFLRTGENGWWHRVAVTIMQRPWVAGGVVLAMLLALAFPLTQLSLAFGSLKNAPQDLESVQGAMYMQQHFRSTSQPTQIVVQHVGPGTLLAPVELAGLRTLEHRFVHDPEVVQVTGLPDFVGASGAISTGAVGRVVSPDLRTAILTLVPRHEVGTKANEDLVRRARAVTHSLAVNVLSRDKISVGGAQADYTDWNDLMYSRFPMIIVIVLVLTYSFLFLAFRSVFLPLKAVVLNLLSVAASYGMLQLVFQRGIGSGLLGFYPESGVASWVPIFLFAFLFGLSMDYEVFLLSRIREHWLSTGNNVASVAFGLEKTGKLITSAALIMIVAFSGLVIGQQIQLKEFGFGMLASVAIDASLIRLVLVPAIMRLMGTINWWVPAPFRGWSTSASHGDDSDSPQRVSEREPVPA